MQVAHCLGTCWTQDAGRELEAIIERDALVEQKRRGSLVALRCFGTPASLLPAHERRPCLGHVDHLSSAGRHRRAYRWDVRGHTIEVLRQLCTAVRLSLIHISEPTRQAE